MDNILFLLLIIVAFLSFIPVVKLYKVQKSEKYMCLKYLIYITFVWTLVVVAERILTHTTVLYYLHMMTYPIKYALGVAMFCTVFNYIEKKMPKQLIYLFGLLFLAELFIAVSNNQFRLIVNLTVLNATSIEALYLAVKGPVFAYHLVITYLILLSSIAYLFHFLAKNKDVVQYKEVTRIMGVSTIVVLTINLMQFLFFETSLDLTYMSLVIVVYALYHTIYTKDMVFNLRTSGRGEILSNMREMYIITNQDKKIVEVSKLLKTKYKLKENYINQSLEDLYQALADHVVFYSDIDVKNNETSDRDHLHIREKKFKLNGMNQYGYMILLYDETQVFHLLRELNRLSNFDTMTGLNNRNFIENLLDNLKDASNVGVVSLDLNGLKINNDYLGHERGDYLLKKLANIMKSVTAPYKHKEMARIGGDEFLIIMFDVKKTDLKDITKRVIEKGKSENINDELSVSIGYSVGSKDNNDIYSLIQEADDKMYVMKNESSKKYQDRMIEYLERLGKFIR